MGADKKIFFAIMSTYLFLHIKYGSILLNWYVQVIYLHNGFQGYKNRYWRLALFTSSSIVMMIYWKACQFLKINAEDNSNTCQMKINVEKNMFKVTKFKICVIGMVVGVGVISLLPFMGLTCRWCTGTGWLKKHSNTTILLFIC